LLVVVVGVRVNRLAKILFGIAAEGIGKSRQMLMF